MPHPAISEQITFLYTHDLSVTEHFYEEILGFSLVLKQAGCRIYRVVGDAYLGFCERLSAPQKPQGVLFTLVTPDVDAWYTYLKDRGVPFSKTPALNETYGIYHCFACDPNGYSIEIQRFLDDDWHQPA